MWFLPGIKKRRRRASSRRRRRSTHRAEHHYTGHKEHARRLIHERLVFWNQFYTLSYGRVAIRNQRSRWGSCSSRGNLNFNYKILFLPLELVDYIIVHELCHLLEFNHSPLFWSHVARTIPDFRRRRKALRLISVAGFLHKQHALASRQQIEYSTPHYGTAGEYTPH